MARPLLVLALLSLSRLSFAQVQVDLSTYFTGDYVRNSGDPTDTTIDASGFCLITDTAAGAGSGLPDNGRFAANAQHPAIQIAATDTNAGNNET